MPQLPYGCYCCDYVQAQLCPDQPPTAKVVFVKAARLPEETSYFSYLGACYSIDPNDPQGQTTPGSHVISSFGAFYEDCTVCVPGGGDSSGGPSGGGFPPGTGGGGGSFTHGWEASLCGLYGDVEFDPPFRLFVRPTFELFAQLEVTDGTGPDSTSLSLGVHYFFWANYCWSVAFEGAEEEVPAGARKASVSFTYDNCADCAEGVPASICGGQEFESFRQVYIRRVHLPATAKSFRYQGLCYLIDPSVPPGPIPDGADVDVIRLPSTNYDFCIECVKGILGELCPDGPEPEKAPIVWCPENAIPAGVTYNRVRGYCYRFDPGAGLVNGSPDYVIFAPVETEYESCAACICGLSIHRYGKKIGACLNQSDAAYAEELWVEQANAPTELRIFRDQAGICREYNPATPLAHIPTGAKSVIPGDEYVNCTECINDRAQEPPRCPPGKIWNGVECVDPGTPPECAPGYHWNGIRCVPDPPLPCPPGTHWVEGVGCVPDLPDPEECPPGYHWVDGIGCVKNTDPICPEPPCTPPPPPFPPPPPPDTGKATQTFHCETGDLGPLVSKGYSRSGGVVKVGGQCYIASHTLVDGTPVPVDHSYYNCEQCIKDKCWWMWEVKYNCNSRTWGAVSQVDRACHNVNPFSVPIGGWYKIGTEENDECIYRIVIEDIGVGTCGAIGDCPWPTAPLPPADDPPPDCCAPCDCALMDDNYTIVAAEIDQGFIAFPNICTTTAVASGGTNWDGVVARSSPGACEWKANPAGSTVGGQRYDFGGREIINPGGVGSMASLQMFATAEGCAFSLTILMRRGDISGPATWSGTKFVGNTPAGTYRRDQACMTPEFMTVVG